MNHCRILSSNSKYELEQKINDLLKEGYILSGVETITIPNYTFVATVTKTTEEKV